MAVGILCRTLLSVAPRCFATSAWRIFHFVFSGPFSRWFVFYVAGLDLSSHLEFTASKFSDFNSPLTRLVAYELDSCCMTQKFNGLPLNHLGKKFDTVIYRIPVLAWCCDNTHTTHTYNYRKFQCSLQILILWVCH